MIYGLILGAFWGLMAYLLRDWKLFDAYLLGCGVLAVVRLEALLLEIRDAVAKVRASQSKDTV